MGIDEIPCQGAQLACMQSIMAKIGEKTKDNRQLQAIIGTSNSGDFSHVDDNGERKKCLPACEDQVQVFMIFVILRLTFLPSSFIHQTLHVLSLSSVPYQHQSLSDEELCILLPRLIQRYFGSR